MDHEPIRDDLLEAMEACRSHSDDLRDPRFAALARQLLTDPELARRFDRLQCGDARLKLAFQDVPVPDGLASRLLERLAASRAEGQEPAGGLRHATEPLAAPATICCPAARPAARFTRRGLFAAAAVAAMAATVMLAVMLGSKAQRPYTPTEVLEDTTQLFASEVPPEGQLVTETPPPADYPLSRDVFPWRDIRWRPVEKLLGVPAVAYDLPGPGGTRATLYVIQRSVPGLPAAAPLAPDWSTGGCSAAAWQSGDLVYVLVVEGGFRDYKNCLNFSRGPLT
jgi:hypothetical protein